MHREKWSGKNALGANPKPQTVAGVAAEPAMKKLSDEEFAKMFSLFFQALAHEAGANLQVLEAFLLIAHTNRSKEAMATVRKLDRLSKLYFRINRLKDFATRDFNVLNVWTVRFDSIFTSKERETLGAKGAVETWQVNYEQVRRIGLRTISKFHPLLKELCKLLTEKEPENADEVMKRLENTEVLIGYVKKVLLDELDFGTETLRKRIGNLKPIGYASDNHKCKIITEYSDEIEQKEVEVIPPLLHLICDNIISNAKRAMVEKGLTEFVVQYNTRIENGMAVFEFKDNGNGMAPGIMDKLNRGEKVSTKSEEGHGLGFWYCRELAEKMGGKLYIKESTVGVGTTVVLELKLAENAVPG